jgi:uncharacterized membrane protein YhhN
VYVAVPVLLLLTLVAERSAMRHPGGQQAPPWWRVALKVALAVAFLAIAGALEGGLVSLVPTDYASTTRLGLALCAVADVALVFRGRAALLTGIVGYAGGHIAFIYAFAVLAVTATGSGSGLLALLPPETLLARLAPLWALGLAVVLPGRAHGPLVNVAVALYAAVLGAMVLIAHATDDAPRRPRFFAALCFMSSDLGVATRRFRAVPSRWVFPLLCVYGSLYYTAMFLFANSAAATAGVAEG